MAEWITGIDGAEISPEGMIGGEVGGPPSGVGVLEVGGRPASRANVALASRSLPRANVEDFYFRGELWIDKASGLTYARLSSDPLFEARPDESASCFVVTRDGVLAFLAATGQTVDDLEAAEAARVGRELQVEEEVARFRARQKQVPLRLAELPDRVEVRPSLRGAAEVIEALGGKIQRGRFGLMVTVAEKLTPPTYPLSWGTTEQSDRAKAAVAAQVLVGAQEQVLAAVDDLAADRSKTPKPLSARLPDEAPAIGALA